CFAVIETSPLTVISDPVPTKATVTSSATSTPTPIPIAKPPDAAAPFSPWVIAEFAESADTVNVPPLPDHDVPSKIAALTMLVRTLTPTEPPTPALSPSASPCGFAVARFASSLAAATDMLPPPVIVTLVVLDAVLYGSRIGSGSDAGAV